MDNFQFVVFFFVLLCYFKKKRPIFVCVTQFQKSHCQFPLYWTHSHRLTPAKAKSFWWQTGERTVRAISAICNFVTFFFTTLKKLFLCPSLNCEILNYLEDIGNDFAICALRNCAQMISAQVHLRSNTQCSNLQCLSELSWQSESVQPSQF